MPFEIKERLRGQESNSNKREGIIITRILALPCETTQAKVRERLINK